jgi:hypothetical protein
MAMPLIFFGQRFTVVGKDGRRRMNRRVAIAVFAFPVLCIFAAAAMAVSAAVYLAGAEKVEGTVVELYEWPGETIMDRGQINYEPVFTFTDAEGQERRASIGSGHTSFNVPVGETHPIWWNPGFDGNARMATFDGLWFMPSVLAVLGLVTLVPAALIWAGLNWLVRRRYPDVEVR